MKIENLSAYKVIEKRQLEDLNSLSYVLEHKKTGGKVVLLSNDDENKVFYIGFKTPPKDSTGVPHIIEHSVLCGSKAFPIKDPFIELAKGSLNTFLNAMTYPDKTIYPVASCNDKDFQNLMHVYLDAVLYPNIYQNKNVFSQEGWHYEMESLEEELTINGVVYNEMKGVFSSPDDVLEREMMNSLYPETTYGYESGGDPDNIPDLTYDDYLDFHRKYYHPSNSYVYLYGNMDMAEKLKFIDEQYFSAFDKLDLDSDIQNQAPFLKMNRVVKDYPINDEDDIKENAYLSWNVSIGDSLDKELYVALQILDYALCSAPGAPLKQTLIDKGIGKDVYSIYENGIKQPFFSVISKNVDASKEEAFLTTIHDVLSDIVKNGFDKKALLAGLNYFEFKYREADFGSYPKGLMYGLQILDSWLYSEQKPFIHIEANQTFANLRSKVEEGFFEGLVQKYLIENPHKSLVLLLPKKGLTAEKDNQLRKFLSDKKGAMSQEEQNRIIEETAALREFQDAEDTKEDLEKIPLLTRADMKKEANNLVNEERTIGDTKVLFHEMFTNEIGYLRLLFNLKDIPSEYFPYIGILKGTLGLLNTENYTYGDLFNEINMVTGGMATVTNVYSHITNAEQFTPTLELKTKVFYSNIGRAIELMQEIILSSDFADEKRVNEILAEGKSRMQAQMISAGHSIAAGRALSYGSASGVISETLSGIPLYRLIAEIDAYYEEKKEELSRKLTELAQMIFRPENLMVDFVGTQEGYDKLAEPIEQLKKQLYTVQVAKTKWIPEAKCKNEGFMTSGQVQYVCRAGNFRKKGLPYKGTLRVLRVMMGYDYLWNNVRVKGGAYGCMCSFGKTGDSYFVSYRDPNLRKTIDVFEKAADFIAEFDADERTMTQFIIGAVSDLDVPMTPATKGLYSLNAYMTGLTEEMLQQERDELLAAEPENIRELAEYIRVFMSDDCLCVVGNAEQIREDKVLFMHTENLY